MAMIQFLVEFAAFANLVALPVLAFVLWVFKKPFSAYLVAKAENVATKQDVAEIVRLQEEVKNEFAVIQEEHKATGALRLAVSEQRFKAHQEAYELWWEMFHSIHSENSTKVIVKCQDWWVGNGLYLDAEPRRAFKVALSRANFHPQLLSMEPRSEKLVRDIKENWAYIEEVGQIIEDAVKLPSLSRSELNSPGPTGEGDNA